MKKILLTFLLLATCLVSAQKDWAVELGVGNHTIADEYVDARDNLFHVDGVVRYNLSDRFGLGLYGGYDKLDIDNVKSGVDTDLNYYRLSLEGVVDMFDLLHLNNKRFNVLTHGGFGASKFGETILPNFSGGVTGLVKLNQRFAVKADFSTTAHFNQRYGLDGIDRVTNVGTNSFITNSTVGLVVYLGKKKKGDHHDFYQEPVVDELSEVRGKIRELHAALLAKQKPVVINQITNQCNCSSDENVFFQNDLPKVGDLGEDAVDIQGRNAIQKIYNLLLKEPTKKVYLNGSASPTDTTTSEYDLALSKRRVEIVKLKLLNLGLDPSRIEISYFGKDKNKENIHEFARKVSLMVR